MDILFSLLVVPGSMGMLVYPKNTHKVMLIQAIFIVEVCAYLVVAVTLKSGPAMLVYLKIEGRNRNRYRLRR